MNAFGGRGMRGGGVDGGADSSVVEKVEVKGARCEGLGKDDGGRRGEAIGMRSVKVSFWEDDEVPGGGAMVGKGYSSGTERAA